MSKLAGEMLIYTFKGQTLGDSSRGKIKASDHDLKTNRCHQLESPKDIISLPDLKCLNNNSNRLDHEKKHNKVDKKHKNSSHKCKCSQVFSSEIKRKQFLAEEMDTPCSSRTVSYAIDLDKENNNEASHSRKLFLEIVSRPPPKAATNEKKERMKYINVYPKEAMNATGKEDEKKCRPTWLAESIHTVRKNSQTLRDPSREKMNANKCGPSGTNKYYPLGSSEDEIISLPDLECPSNNWCDYERKYEETNKCASSSHKRKCSQVCLPETKIRRFSPEVKDTACSSKAISNINLLKDSDAMPQSGKLLLNVSMREYSALLKCKNNEEEERMKYINNYLRKSETTEEITNCAGKEVEKKKCRLVSSLNRIKLQSLLRKHQSKLRDISCRKIFSRRHEDYKRGGKAKYQLTFQVNMSPFRDEQLDHVVQFLMSEFYENPIKEVDYILKVLFAEALIFIYMDFHRIDYEESEKRMVEATFNEENAG